MPLTKYREGSMRELWKISLPLMLSSFSVMAMIFVDRILLVHYSTAALNATVNASTFGWSFVGSWMAMTSIAQVFVAQHNGAGRTDKLGEPVWQMIWLSLGSILFFIPFALWGGEFVYGDKEMEREYLHWMMFFAPSTAMYGALCGFFVGQGKTTLVTVLAIVANFINAGLDVALIFGIEGFIPSMGVKGAAIATSGSGFFQVLVLFAIFMKKQNREQFGTSRFAFQKKSFWPCIRIGFPNAVFVGIEILGWAVFYWMMTLIGEKYITIAAICQSIILLFYFIGDGVSKASTAIVGNMIGAGRHYLVPKVLISGIRIHLTFFLLMILCFVFSADLIVELFLPDVSAEMLDSVQESLITSLSFFLIYLLFEWIRLLFSGILTAAGDTMFLLIAGSLSVWIFLILPVYMIVVKGHASIEVATIICALYGVGACSIYLWRFMKGKWKAISITAS